MLRELRNRLIWPVSLLCAFWLFGTLGYALIGGGKWSIMNCAFMTAITLSGVGYGDVLGIIDNPTAKIFTMIIIILGMGVMLYCLSTITAFVVEGGINTLFKERIMLKNIANMKNHFIVAGAGATGFHVITEMRDSGADFVVVEFDRDNIQKLHDEFKGIHCVCGDATDDDTLINAGIQRAKGLVACLSSDKDNLYITVTAKNLNPNIIVVARAIAVEMKQKLERVGADAVVSPSHIGGLRMATEILQPRVTSFLDKMMRSGDASTKFGEVTISRGSKLDGKTLGESRIKEETGMVVVAAHRDGEADATYNPRSGYPLSAGTTIIVIGEESDIRKLESMARA